MRVPGSPRGLVSEREIPVSLKESILDWIQFARRSPNGALDPKELAALEKEALRSRDGLYGGVYFPLAKYRWEVSVNLATADSESDRIPFQPPFPVRIVGMMPWVEVTGTGQTAPTTKSVLVDLDINESSQLTNAQGRVTTSAAKDGNFVTLASLGMSSPEGGPLGAFDWRIETSVTAIGFTFKWKQANTYDDAIIGVTMFAHDIDDNRRVGSPR